jgi:hypothetical protein
MRQIIPRRESGGFTYKNYLPLPIIGVTLPLPGVPMIDNALSELTSGFRKVLNKGSVVHFAPALWLCNLAH